MADSGKPPGPPDASGSPGGPAYGFSDAGFKRVTRAVKLVEKELVPAAVGPRGRYPIGGGGGGQVAIVKTTITARSGKQYGTGTVTFQVANVSGLAKDGVTDIKVWNPYAASLAVGEWVTLIRTARGWTIFGADCA